MFSCWSCKEDLHYSISKHGNEITKVCKIMWFLRKKQWRWRPVAGAPFQQPRNAAVLKSSQPRTSDTAIWASLIVAGPYFLALLPWALQPFSLTLCCTTAWNISVDLPCGPLVVANIRITAWIFDSLNCWCIKGLYYCTSMTPFKLSLLRNLFGDNILTWQHFFFIKKHVICFS